MKRLDYDGQPFHTKGVFYKISFSCLRDIFDLIHSFTFYYCSETNALFYMANFSSFKPGLKGSIFKGFSLTTLPNICLHAPPPWNPVPYAQPWPCSLSFYHLMLLYFRHCWHDIYLFVVCLPPQEHKHAESRSMPVYLHWYLSHWGHLTQRVLSKCISWMKKWMKKWLRGSELYGSNRT